MKTPNHYDLLFAAVTSLVQHYRDDLIKHDLSWITKNPEVPFLHVARLTGTTLIPLWPHDHADLPPAGQEIPYLFGRADREHIVRQALPMVQFEADPRNGFGPEKVWHHFDGRDLARISPGSGVTLATRHVDTVLSHWIHEATNIPAAA